LAKGTGVSAAVATAHDFVKAALREGFPLNRHVGPLYHKALAKSGRG
jgi:hydroxymethylpyrimidine/phosphomethylpyrimidine kinase